MLFYPKRRPGVRIRQGDGKKKTKQNDVICLNYTPSEGIHGHKLIKT